MAGGGACMVEGGHAWWGGVHGRGVCMAGACMAGGCAWHGGMHGRGGMCGRRACVAGGHAWQRGACMTGGMCGRGRMCGGGSVCGGNVWQGGAWPCDLSHHAFDVTCMLPPHQLRPTNSATPYIVLVGHVTHPPPLLTESQTGVKT